MLAIYAKVLASSRRFGAWRWMAGASTRSEGRVGVVYMRRWGGRGCGPSNKGSGRREIDGWRLEHGWGVLQMVPMHVAGAWCEVGAADGCSGDRALPMRVQGGYRGCGMARWLGWRSMESDGVR